MSERNNNFSIKIKDILSIEVMYGFMYQYARRRCWFAGVGSDASEACECAYILRCDK